MIESSDEPIDVVFLVLAHDQPGHLARLVDRLTAPGTRFVVHIDANRDLKPFEESIGSRSDLVFVRDRVRVRWAAWSQVEATLRAMRTALDRWGKSASHHVLLSGADYPLRPVGEIVQYLGDHRGHQFIRRFDLLRHGDARQRRRVTGRHLRQLADRNTAARKPIFLLEHVISLVPRRIPRGLRIMSGSQWWALTPDCADDCLRYARDNPRRTRFFRQVFAPDEIFFHSIVESSKWETTARAAEPYYEVTEIGGPWRYGNLHYLNAIVPIDDLTVLRGPLKDPDVLFARKFSEVGSARVLDAIDALLHLAAGGTAPRTAPSSDQIEGRTTDE